jgi:NADH-quinone oxidoreductase subunit L
VYLIARSQPLFSLAPQAAEVATWVGALTAIFAATIAVAQFDIKKVLAYSTISQLGFMVAAVGMGAYVAGIFHLVTHAFFKALLFLGAGSVILGMERGAEAGHGQDAQAADADAHIDPQDMHHMGGLYNRMPRTFWVYLAGALALSGIAPLAGFFSKDEILGAAAGTHLPVFIILVLTAFLTAFYMGRQVLLIFFGQPRSQAAARATESPMIISIPLLILAILSIAGGALNLPGQYFLEHWLEHSLTYNLAVPFEWPVALLSLGLALTGLVLAWGVYGRRKLFTHAEEDDRLAPVLGPVFTGMQNKWWVDELYGFLLVRPYKAVADFFAGWVDQGVIDGFFNGLGSLSRGLAGLWSKLQNGYVRSYAAWVVLGVAVILVYLMLR